jgi:hypothetical protein
LGQLKSTLYARMEEVSFRSGAAVTGGVLTAAGAALTPAHVPGGPRSHARQDGTVRLEGTGTAANRDVVALTLTIGGFDTQSRTP